MSREAQNLLIPFRRDKKRDFAVGSGETLLASKVRQALLTEGATARSSGELPWRTNFGAGLALLRHQRIDAALKVLARVFVRDALRRRVAGAVSDAFPLAEGAEFSVEIDPNEIDDARMDALTTHGG